MFPAFDGAAAYTLVRQIRPKRIIEIGSGNSTRFLARALRDGGIDCAFTCIDPAPRIPVEGLGVARIPRLLEETDAELCAGLGPDDILFIDSSHILLPGWTSTSSSTGSSRYCSPGSWCTSTTSSCPGTIRP